VYVSSRFDVDPLLLCDSTLFAFLNIGSFPFFDDDTPLILLVPEVLVIDIGLLELIDVDPSEILVVGAGLLKLIDADPSDTLVVDIDLPGVVAVDTSEIPSVDIGCPELVAVDFSESLGADSMLSQTASEIVTSFLETQLIDKLKRIFDAVRQLCAPPTSRDILAV
jgi:hypothetical protein